MAYLDVNDILGKLNELRAVFVLGQRALPFIEEIFLFLKEVAPLLEEINSSMMDSALKMPHATSQLQSISNATKTTTTEILDLIDEVLVHAHTYDGSLDQTLNDAEFMGESDERLLALLRDRLGDRTDVIDEVDALFEERRVAQHNIEGSVHARRTVVKEIRMQMDRIMSALQVQDITAQQIASVTHLLDSMRTRMAALLERLDAQHHEPLPMPGTMQAPADAAFDPHARYDRSDERQRAADAVFNAPTNRDDAGLAEDTEIERIFHDAALAIQMRRSGKSRE